MVGDKHLTTYATDLETNLSQMQRKWEMDIKS